VGFQGGTEGHSRRAQTIFPTLMNLHCNFTPLLPSEYCIMGRPTCHSSKSSYYQYSKWNDRFHVTFSAFRNSPYPRLSLEINRIVTLPCCVMFPL